MSRQSVLGPLCVLAIGMTLIVLMLVGPGRPTNAEQTAQTAYPATTKTATKVPTKISSFGYPDPSSEPTTTTPTTRTTTTTATSTTRTTSSPTASSDTPTQETSPSPSITTETPFESPTEVPFETIEPATQETEIPTATLIPTPTFTPTPSNLLTCVPGVPIEITGVGPARAALLLYFNQRPVGGGSVMADGQFAIPLMVGQERPGQYPVTVRVRGSQQVLRRITCVVPEMTPTPTIVRR